MNLDFVGAFQRELDNPAWLTSLIETVVTQTDSMASLAKSKNANEKGHVVRVFARALVLPVDKEEGSPVSFVPASVDDGTAALTGW